jgi:hypothetical protein
MNSVSNLFYWEWPNDEEYVGFILGRSLLHIGNWTCFSPSDITKLVENPIHKPSPSITPHTRPKQSWTMPLPQDKGKIFYWSNILYILQKKLNHPYP